jgi:hypothetical protein
MGPGVDIKRTNMDSRSMYTPTLSVTPLPPHGGGTHKTKQPPEKATGPGGTGDAADAKPKGPRATTHAQGGAQARPRTPQASTTHSRPLIVRTHSAGVVPKCKTNSRAPVAPSDAAPLLFSATAAAVVVAATAAAGLGDGGGVA